MVFTSLVNLALMKTPVQYWKVRRVKRLTSHFYGRLRNCYKLAIRAMRHSLQDARRGRQYRRRDLIALQLLRINAAAEEHSLSGRVFGEGLQRNLILLNKKVLADLAIWEPRTFKALTDIAKARALSEDDLSYASMDKKDISHIYCSHFLKKN